MTRIVVVGAGVAGTAAALAARAGGAEVTVLDGGAGASSLAGGAMDVTSWEDTPREGETGADDVLAETAVAAALAELGELVRPTAVHATIATMAGIVRPARAVDRALLDLSPLTAGIVFVPRADHPSWDAGALARAWNDTRIARARGVEFVAIDATLTRFVDERHLAHAELAARHDDPARLAWLAARVKDALGRRTEARVLGVIVPPWLGLDETREAALSAAVGLPCGEPLVGPGGPSGLRFERTRDRAFARREIAVVAARAKEIAQDGEEWHVTLERGAPLVADRIVLATGGLVGGGLAYAPSNAVLAGEVPARARAATDGRAGLESLYGPVRQPDAE